MGIFTDSLSDNFGYSRNKYLLCRYSFLTFFLNKITNIQKNFLDFPKLGYFLQ